MPSHRTQQPAARSDHHGQDQGRGDRQVPDQDHSHDQHDSHDQDHEHHHGHGHGDDHAHGHEHPGGVRGVLASVFRAHSHDAADSVDAALESSAQGIRAVKLSLLVLGLTALAQAVLVVVTGSVALLADTIHNFSDALTALPLWVAFAVSERRPTRRYTYGYGRAEDLAGIFIVAMIALSAVVAGWESIRRLLDPHPLDHPWVLVAAGLIGFAGNEAVACYRVRVGRKIGSAALVADGLHARTDGFTSLAVLIGALGALAGFPLADPIVGLFITVAILFVLRGAARDIYRRLMDAVEPDLVGRAEESLAATPGVVEVEGVRLRWIGHKVRAEVGITVDPKMSVVEAHAVSTEAHHRLLHDVPKLVEATVHVSPTGDEGDAQHAALAHHRDPIARRPGSRR
jgi:cation diffusion facilitator family transporter